MADNYISGNGAFVKLGTVAYNFNKWRCAVDGGIKKFFAFGSNFQRTLPGGVAAEITLEGPYNQGNMPLAAGAVYVFHLGWDTGIELVVSGRVANIEFGAEVGQGEDPAPVTVTVASEGSFTAELI